ncbi:HlyD family efflux transporter periplasmic adaptor subunit [Candidatus Uhrbacteria bacterium]|nr:HlyD family efflux transporter periplasmic adaptor subunit [Candidatus Uhrbacteria bacterium]
MLSRSPQARTLIMLLGLWAVVVGAWTVYRGFAKTPVPTVKAQLRPITRRIQTTAHRTGTDTLVEVKAARDGIVSIVPALEGQTVARGDVLVEFERSAQENLVLSAVEQYLQSMPVADSTMSAREASDQLQSLEGKLNTANKQADQALQRARTVVAEHEQVLKKIQDAIAGFEKDLADLPQPATQGEQQSQSKEVQDAISLMRISVEGGALSEDLTLSDIRSLFGVDGTTSSFLKALPQPQLAVPLWEKLLEAQRLQRIVSDRLKQPASDDAQAEQQLLLTSKAISETAIDILGGLKDLLGTIEPSDKFPLAEHQATERLIERNRSAIEATLDTLQAHEQRFLGVWQERGDSLAKELAAGQQIRAALQAAFIARSKELTAYDRAIASAWAQVVASRQQRSALIEQQKRLSALFDAKTKGGQRAPASAKGSAALQTNVALQQEALEELTIHAPVAGVIDATLVHIGDVVHAGEPLLRIRSIGATLETQVDPNDAATIAPGMVVELTGTGSATSVETAIVHGRTDAGVIQLSPLRSVAEGGSASVTATIVLSTGNPVVAIPGWLAPKTTPAAVTVLMGDGKLQSRTVTIGMRGDDGWVEVQSGLSEGDAVVGELLQ